MKRRSLRIVILGLSLSSAWGNGHATTYRALIRSLSDRGHRVMFLERDVPWYAANRDLIGPACCELHFYDGLAGLEDWKREIASADLVIIGSFVPDGIAVADWVFRVARGKIAFYDIDTPVTLSALARGTCTYLSPAQVRQYACYFSFTGGPTLKLLVDKWRARSALALYCSVDTTIYKPQLTRKRWDLGYIGTYSADRQPGVERFINEVARQLPEMTFVVAGAQYPSSIRWPENVERIEHVPPSKHAEFYSSLGWALNLTRADMRTAGFSPSVRLFEAAACETPIISDDWPGLEAFFVPDQEIVTAESSEHVTGVLQMPAEDRRRIGEAARERVLLEHTSDWRAIELENWFADGGRDESRAKMDQKGKLTSVDQA
ncbi:CgeB family protein [Hyphomicrobium sp.]|uniref:CgeB family protein n=1 Tax=Hyphomicrobium sp. TaxID=82 RepID=UPI002D784801|nr:glycosyltransferase [Hyphomicrobium sp.]HET6390383.1 glycosyltransferase [Hyphomicrobium sp.]